MIITSQLEKKKISKIFQLAQEKKKKPINNLKKFGEISPNFHHALLTSNHDSATEWEGIFFFHTSNQYALYW